MSAAETPTNARPKYPSDSRPRAYTPSRASSFARWYAKNRERCLKQQKVWRASPEGKLAAFAQVCRRHGITVEDWQREWDASGGRCRGCENAIGRGQHTHIDHDHATGKFRGLLCSNCNHVLGKVKDEPATLRRLAAYLERSV